MQTLGVEAYKVMNTLDDTLVTKAIYTLRDSQARKIKDLYYSKHTCNKDCKCPDATGYRQTLVTHALTG